MADPLVVILLIAAAIAPVPGGTIEATVIRGGQLLAVDVAAIVPGDRLRLAAGDRTGGGGRLAYV